MANQASTSLRNDASCITFSFDLVTIKLEICDYPVFLAILKPFCPNLPFSDDRAFCAMKSYNSNNQKKPSNIRKPYSRKPPQQRLPSLNHLLMPSPPSKLDRISLPPPVPVYQTLFYEEEDYLFKELLSIYSTDEQVLSDASFFFFGNTNTCSSSLPINTSKDFVLFEPLEQQQKQHSSIKKKLIPDLDNNSLY